MSLPRALSNLLTAPDPAARDAAWAEFQGEFSRLMIRTARRACPDADEAMDCHTYALDRLREDDFRRLRAFAADGRGKFTTWLVVVVRRLCVDHRRARYGRPQATAETNGRSVAHQARRRLVELVAQESDPDRLDDGRTPNPEEMVVMAERHALLADALARLDPADQLLLTLRFQDDIPAEKIASMVGAPSRFHVHRRLKRLLADLRTNLERKGVTEP